MMEPSITVVIPAYKAAGVIRRALESVFAQTRPATEVLVVDDGSPDDLAGAVAPYDRVRLVRKANGGAASARNLGVDEARGDLIAFLDADDYGEPDKLERQEAVLHEHPDVGLVAGWFCEQLPGRPRERATTLDARYFGRVLRMTGEEAFVVATQIWTGTVLVRRAALSQDRFVSGLEPAEDRDLWIRLIARVPVYLIPETLATAVLEPQSLSRSNIDVDCGNMLRVIERNRELLNRQALRHWEALTFRRWAANHLAQGRPRAAIWRALQRLRLQPFSVEGWWILLKSSAMACAGRSRQEPVVSQGP